jgi:hypothetical protein
MTSQAIPRGHHPGPRRGEVLDTEPKLGAPCGFQCQDKTQWETKVLTSVLVREGSLGPRVPANWRVQKPHLSPWGLVDWVGVESGLGLGSLVHMWWPSFAAVSTMVPGGSVLRGWHRTTFGDCLGCREVEDGIGLVFVSWLGLAWFGVGALLLCHVCLGSEASKHCKVHSRSM